MHVYNLKGEEVHRSPSFTRGHSGLDDRPTAVFWARARDKLIVLDYAGEGTGIYDLIQGLQGRSLNVGNTAATIANPNRPYAGGEAQALSGMLTDPSSFLTNPYYTTGLTAGINAVNAGDSAAGLQDSGNRGRGGISPLLFSAGYDQRKVIEIFNGLFSARLMPGFEVPRLAGRRHGT